MKTKKRYRLLRHGETTIYVERVRRTKRALREFPDWAKL